MSISEMRETCGSWDDELGCTMDDAEENCPFYEECKAFGDGDKTDESNEVGED